MYVSCNIHGQFSGCQLFIAKLKALSDFISVISVISDDTSSQILYLERKYFLYLYLGNLLTEQ